ncbi:hypothetical protein GYH30_015962 [Glycine max]|uniref:Uncharacterized protein n=2 Tax=Glycine subgen. Soja TaxID=1462606 RepID=A0A0R0JKL9_SOYBN|nr:hypothetical protein JHK87_016075 [Glycine soja]KAH1127195.1 hypothetical protein GYH30_015962 [Glycine max]RZC08780.1 hypothetical protein D0Y65_015474 [Glycine soja]
MVFNNQLFIPEKVMDETLFHTWSWLSLLIANWNKRKAKKTKRGTSNNLKVVHLGTKEFKIASNKRDLFLGFFEHQERLRKKLALEEGRIFVANEQLS